MARGVVHPLQTVQVGERYEQRLIAAAREAQIARGERQEPAPVVQPGQLVHERHVEQRGMEPVPLDRVAQRPGQELTVDVAFHEEVLRAGAHGFETVALVVRVRDEEERDGGGEGPQLGERREAAAGGKRHEQEDDVDSTLREPGERRLRRRRRHGELVRGRVVQQLPHPAGGILVVAAHHQHDEPVARRVGMAPVGEVTAVRRQPAIELLPIAPLLVERDELHAALADAALEVTAARRQQPPLGGVVPARDHVPASRTRQVKDGARTSWCTIAYTIFKPGAASTSRAGTARRSRAPASNTPP